MIWFLVLGSAFAAAPVFAKSADCLLEIDGKAYIDGVCQMSPGEKGSFQIGSSSRGRLDYFASVDVEGPGRATGFWNLDRGAAHAHTPLGALKAAGACWTNAHVRICAWKIGEKRYFADAPASASTSIPRRVGDCVQTEIASLGSRLEGMPSSGSAVEYANGLGGVSYDVVDAVRRARVGDRVTLCLVSVPENCPKGDDRGKVYSAVDQRTGLGWSLSDSQHMCGGA